MVMEWAKTGMKMPPEQLAQNLIDSMHDKIKEHLSH